MSEIKIDLLDNLFDSLDRLFDRQCSIYDVHDLMFATEIALRNSNSSIELTAYIKELKLIIRSGKSQEVKREEALRVTNSLRFKSSDLLDDR